MRRAPGTRRAGGCAGGTACRQLRTLDTLTDAQLVSLPMLQRRRKSGQDTKPGVSLAKQSLATNPPFSRRKLLRASVGLVAVNVLSACTPSAPPAATSAPPAATSAPPAATSAPPAATSAPPAATSAP